MRTTADETEIDEPAPGGVGPPRRPVAAAVAAGLVAALALSVAPRTPQLSGRSTGDADLAGRVRDLAGNPSGRLGLAVALITTEGVRTAGLGRSGNPAQPTVTPDTPFEVGSVAKAMTGMLLASLAGDGVVDPDTTVGEALPGASFEDPPVAAASLAQLASHRSGLPRLASGLSLRSWAWSSAASLFGVNPYASGGEGREALIASAAATGAARPAGEFGYSNLGGALLGQILADAAGTSYRRLLADRLLEPLSMDRTRVLADGGALPVVHAVGHHPNGRPVEAWRDSGYGPAGIGVWSTAADLGRLVRAVLDGTAPGAAAAAPRFETTGGGRIGFGWMTDEHGGRTVTWHNGGTGGFRSDVGFDPEAGRGVVVLSNTAVATRRLALHLLGVEEPDGPAWWSTPRSLVSIGLLAVAVLSAWRFRSSRRRGPASLETGST